MLMLPYTYTKRLRLQVLEKYGNKCACCGITAFEHLTINHKNGDGALEKRQIIANAGWNGTGREGGVKNKLYRLLRDSPIRDDINVLCWNCNAAEHYHGGCPHRVADST